MCLGTNCARRALSQAQLPYHVKGENVDTDRDEDCLGTMHLAKGLEFRCVACTRARDRRLVTRVGPASEFLADLA